MSELPMGWIKVSLGNLGQYLNGAAFKPSDWTNEGIPIIRIQNLTDSNKPFNHTKKSISEELLVKNGDILVSWSATLDAFIWDRGEAWLNQHIFRVLPNPGIVEKQFLFFVLKREIASLIETEHLHGSTMKHINRGPFLSHSINLPPLNEQRRIVAKLDSLFTRSRRAREELGRVSGLVQRYKQAVLAAAFRGDLTADWREKNSKLEPWQSISLGSVIQNLRYGTSKKCDYLPILTPVLRIPNIGDGYIIHDDIKYAEFDSKEIVGLQLQVGDILIIRSNGSLDLVGKAAIVSDKEVGFLYAGYLIRLRPNRETILSKYLYYHLKESETRSKIELLAKSTSGVNNINSQELQSLSLNIPKLQEQKEIVQRVEKLFKAIDLMEQEHQKASQLLDRLEQATLAKAFRGELVPQDPNDEPAAALLERIQAERQARPQGKAVKSKQSRGERRRQPKNY